MVGRHFHGSNPAEATTVHLIPESEHVFAFGRIANGVPTKLYWRDVRLVFMPDGTGRIVRYEARAVGRDEAVLVGKRVEVARR